MVEIPTEQAIEPSLAVEPAPQGKAQAQELAGASSDGSSSTGIPAFRWPTDIREISSPFGWRLHPVLGFRHHHDGIDISLPEGTAIHAAALGTVYFYGEQPGYGNVLIVEHASDYYTLYGHLNSSLVKPGERVAIGQAIGSSGNTGISPEPHLHFEIRENEFAIDPLALLPP